VVEAQNRISSSDNPMTRKPFSNSHSVEEKMVNMPEQTVWHRHGWQSLRRTIGALALCVMAPLATAGASVQESFESPEAGVSALVEAVKSNDQRMLRSILGPHSRKLVSSGDEVADAHNREAFIKTYSEANKIVLSDSQAILVIGDDEWPMPIPLVKSGGRWRFDSSQGEMEILVRRIGANELAAIQVCLAIVDAEHEYAAQDRAGDGVLHYAARFVSTPGNHDGLYWEAQTDEPPSPLGPLLAAAANEGYTNSEFRTLEPYHGYYYKILTSQGADAPGGAYDYLVNGKMIGGFAVLAYPARYGASGIMSFMVNHEGVVYERNLGRRTAERAAKITSFNPDATWKKQ
jgi:hypothetical protein